MLIREDSLCDNSWERLMSDLADSVSLMDAEGTKNLVPIWSVLAFNRCRSFILSRPSQSEPP